MEVRDFRECVEEKLEALSKQMKELGLEEKEQETLKLHEQRNQQLLVVLNRLNVVDCQKDQDLESARCERRHHSSSGDWIFDHPVFSEWADLTIARNSTLYLSGIPGAGPLRFYLCPTQWLVIC